MIVVLLGVLLIVVANVSLNGNFRTILFERVPLMVNGACANG